MDTLDFAILAALQRAPRVSYAELGTRVGLSANAVKARVYRMLAEGVLQGFAALPRASLLGYREGLLLFTGAEDVDAREDEILRGLAEVPGVRFTDLALDHSVYVWILYRDDADWERIERAAISLVGKPPATLIRESSPLDPPRELAPADWKIVRAIQNDGRAQAKDLTVRAGLSFKPLKRRLENLLREGDLRVVPIVSPIESAGGVLFRIVCFMENADVEFPSDPDRIVTREAPGVLSILARRSTFREARTLQREIASMPGIERAILQIGTRRASLAWLDDAIVRRLEATPLAPSALAPVPRPR